MSPPVESTAVDMDQLGDTEPEEVMPSLEQFNDISLRMPFDRTWVKQQLRRPVHLDKLDSAIDPFIANLRQAYLEDYGGIRMTLPGGQALKWCGKIAFTERSV